MHYTCGDLSKMQRLSPAMLVAIQNHLLVQSTFLGKSAFRVLQQELGWTFSVHSLPQNDMATIANIPDSIFWDWQHTTCSSGGVAQYEVNGFLRKAKGLSPELLDNLDEFVDNVTLPKQHQKDVKKGLSLRERMVDKRGKHLKAFASEMLSLVVVVCLWAQWCLQPMGVLEDEIKSLLLLGRILYLLRTGNKAIGKLPLLQKLILEHHDLFVKLYPDGAKPKCHLLLHIPELFARFLVNLSCFVTERKHKQSKFWGAFCYNKMCHTMLRKNLKKHFEHFASLESVQNVALLPPGGLRIIKKCRRQWKDKLVAVGLLPLGAVPNFLVANGARTPCGQIFKNDLVMFCGSDGSVLAGFVKFFFKFPEPQPGAQPTFFAVVNRFKHLGTSMYSKHEDHVTTALVELSDILGSFPYLAVDDVVFVVASADVLM